MTITGYSNAIVNLMLSWLKGLANWVLRLFNLAGSVGGSPLLWLSENWLKLLAFFLILGLALDRLVWLIRWRPYWVWFRKERIIVNDDKFFAHENLEFDEDWDEDDGELHKNWQERDYVVASTVVKRSDDAHTRRSVVRSVSPDLDESNRKHMTARTYARSEKSFSGKKKAPSRSKECVERMHNYKKPRPVQRKRTENSYRHEIRDEDLFGVATNQPDVSDFYEDEVFNVSNLPFSDEFQEKRE